ncbi:hypothetical protein SSBR45G_60600 [Bradyrhizobium sp. SSBR45G]|nr:hypothetical protein SSBR45G_60600 [Bradyrhizobium sp. SSBR45G]GLH88477.1 hypothetical protein SSBR45R_59380 [Bradyrhizobium sp. SSBR45R]
MGPFGDTTDKTMLHWINVAILHVPGIIVFVADQMLPISTLPDTSLPVRKANRAQALGSWQLTREAIFDQPPAS